MPEIADKSEGQKGAEAEVDSRRRDLGPFVVAAEDTRMPMVFTNAREPGNRIIFANDAFLSLTGYLREEVLGQPFSFLAAQAGKPEALAELENEFAGRNEGSLELECRRKDGSPFWAALFLSPVRDEAGETVQHFASFVDLTRHRREADHLRFLLDEVNHRTQNTLATVLAIAAQTLRNAVDRDLVGDFEARIVALSRAHALLGRDAWLAVNLRDVVDQILAPFGPREGDASRFRIRGDDVRVPPKPAVTLAMMFHELATNAAKYGALSEAGAGRVEVTWTVAPTADGQDLHIGWQELGGPVVAPPTHKGFGSRLIEGGLARELNGEVHLDFAPGGLVCRIVMPLPRDERG